MGRMRRELPLLVLEETMMGIVRRGAFETGIQRLSLAAGLPEKAGRTTPIVRQADWLFFKAVTKHKARSGRESVNWARVQ